MNANNFAVQVYVNDPDPNPAQMWVTYWYANAKLQLEAATGFLISGHTVLLGSPAQRQLNQIPGVNRT